MAGNGSTANLTSERTGDQTGVAASQDQGDIANAPAAIIKQLFGLGDFASARTYKTLRSISADPTIALVKSIVYNPVLTNSWTWKITDARLPDIEKVREIVQANLDPLHFSLVRSSIRALEFGWSPHEIVWKRARIKGAAGAPENYVVVDKVKPLLWENTRAVVDDHGNLIALENSSGEKKPVTIGGDKVYCFSYDGECGNPYGRPRHANLLENGLWDAIRTTEKRLAEFNAKTCGIIPMIKYPDGTSRDANGADRSNRDLAIELLASLQKGDPTCWPNKAGSVNDPLLRAKLSDQSDWTVEFMQTGPINYAIGIIEQLRYRDMQKVRAWLRPERAVLESRHGGSKADSVTHTITGEADIQIVDYDMCQAINHYIIGPMLRMNFGEEYEGSLRIEPAEQDENSSDDYVKILTALLANKNVPPEDIQAAIDKVDWDELFDNAGVPTLEHVEGGGQVTADQPEE
jgi:hypothetical protein